MQYSVRIYVDKLLTHINIFFFDNYKIRKRKNCKQQSHFRNRGLFEVTKFFKVMCTMIHNTFIHVIKNVILFTLIWLFNPRYIQLIVKNSFYIKWYFLYKMILLMVLLFEFFLQWWPALYASIITRKMDKYEREVFIMIIKVSMFMTKNLPANNWTGCCDRIMTNETFLMSFIGKQCQLQL